MTLLAERAYAKPFQSRATRLRVASKQLVGTQQYKGGGIRVRNRALAHALKQLHSVARVHTDSWIEMRRLLRDALKDDSVFATVSSDGDDGLIAQWRAGRSYLAIEVGPEESSLTYADR